MAQSVQAPAVQKLSRIARYRPAQKPMIERADRLRKSGISSFLVAACRFTKQRRQYDERTHS